MPTLELVLDEECECIEMGECSCEEDMCACSCECFGCSQEYIACACGGNCNCQETN